ncbi:MAG: hypothetical protein ACKVH8_07145 [Pirellulales bacterium]
MDESKQLAFVTVVSSNYLHFAKALGDTIARVHPECKLIACVSDWDQVPAVESRENILWVLGSELITDGSFHRYAFKYDAMEFTTSFKPRIVQWALEQDYQNVVFLDGDIQLYQRLDEITDDPSDFGVCLTPHLLSPLPKDGLTPEEDNFLSAGVYNTGFVAVRNNENGLKFTRWWTDRLSNICIIDIAGNQFVDQKWVDLVPSLFDGVKILRRPGFHSAYWNLHGCIVTGDDQGSVLIDGHPLTLFHYSGFDPHLPSDLSKHQDRIQLEHFSDLVPLASAYAELLFACDYNGHSKPNYQFSNMSDGTVIKPFWREAVRTNHPALADVENPFDVSANPGIYQKFMQALPDVVDSRVDWRLHPNAAYKGRSKTMLKLRKAWKKVKKYFRKAG